MFSQSDLDTICEAVQRAERRTRGEIVPMVVAVSARYRDASYLAGLIVALVTLAALVSLDYGLGRWRWLAERTFAWLMRYQRMSKDYERLPATSEATIY